MHIVTKILVVFCAVFALLLSALTIAYSANANAIRASVSSLQSQAEAARAEAQAQIAQAADERDTQAQRAAGLKEQLDTALRRADQAESERSEAVAERERALAEVTAIRNQIGQLGATVDTQTSLIRNYRDEVTALRDALLRATQREIELTDHVNDLESAREVLEQNARALKEQLEESRLALQAAQQGGTGTSATTGAARELPGPLVRARVTEVFPSAAGDQMVVIDQGANRGLKENVLMNVIRGDQFVGSIVLTAVEPNRAVGRVKLTNASANGVSTDDVVLSRLN